MQTEPKTRRNSIALAAYVLAAMLLILTIDILVLPRGVRLFREVHNFGHTPAFGLLSLLVLGMLKHSWWRSRIKARYQYLIAGTVSLIIGFAVEVYQIVGPRDADFFDLLRNLAGVVAFLGLWASFDNELVPHRLKQRRSILIGLSALILVVPSLPVIAALETYRQRNARFPVLVDADAWRGRWFLRAHDAYIEIAPSPTNSDQDREDLAVRLTLLPDEDYPGMELTEPCPDWSAYEALNIKLESILDTNWQFVLSVSDRQHNGTIEDRYTLSQTLMPGRQQITIPLSELSRTPSGRNLDLTAISKINLYTLRVSDTSRLWIYDLRLE
jgi:hypothetical protein